MSTTAHSAENGVGDLLGLTFSPPPSPPPANPPQYSSGWSMLKPDLPGIKSPKSTSSGLHAPRSANQLELNPHKEVLNRQEEDGGKPERGASQIIRNPITSSEVKPANQADTAVAQSFPVLTNAVRHDQTPPSQPPSAITKIGFNVDATVNTYPMSPTTQPRSLSVTRSSPPLSFFSAETEPRAMSDMPSPPASAITSSPKSHGGGAQHEPYQGEDYWSNAEPPLAMDQIASSWHHEGYGGGPVSAHTAPWVMSGGALVTVPTQRQLPFHEPAKSRPVRISAPTDHGEPSEEKGKQWASSTDSPPRNCASPTDTSADKAVEGQVAKEPPLSDGDGRSTPVSSLTASLQGFSISPQAKKALESTDPPLSLIEKAYDKTLQYTRTGNPEHTSPVTHEKGLPAVQLKTNDISAEGDWSGSEHKEGPNSAIVDNSLPQQAQDPSRSELSPRSQSTLDHSSPQVEGPDEDRLYSRNDRRCQTADELKELDLLWREYRDAYGQFSAGVEEVMARVRLEAKSNQVDAITQEGADANTRSVAEIRCLAYQSQLRKTKGLLQASELKVEQLGYGLSGIEAQLAAAREEAADLQTVNSSLEKDKAENELRKTALMQSYLSLEEEVHLLKASVTTPSGINFVLVLLEGSTRLFDRHYVSDGYDGGLDLANRVRSKAKEIMEIVRPDTAPMVVVIQVYTDLDILRKEYHKIGMNWSNVREFLDGFVASNDLTTVMDVPGKERVADKIINHSLVYGSTKNCQMIMLSPLQEEAWFQSLHDLKALEIEAKIYGIRSTFDITEDPFVRRGFGNDRLVFFDCLFSDRGDPDPVDTGGQPTRPSSVATIRPSDEQVPNGVASPHQSSRSLISMVRSTAPPSVASSAAPSSPSQSQRMNPQEEAFATAARRTHAKPPLTPPQEARKAPWLDITASTQSPGAPKIPRVAKPLPPPAGGGSLLDQLLEMKSHASQASSPTLSDRTILPDSVRDSGTQQSRQHPAASGTNARPALTIAWDASTEGSIGGSPPSSDEDKPSVHLPHSAVKHVQRPPQYTRDTSPPPSTYAPSANSSPSAASTERRHPSRAANQTGANLFPVGSRSGDSSADLMDFASRREQNATKQYGFKWHEAKTDYKIRRQTEEYKILRHFDPPPCHKLYLQGECYTPGCKFGHDYTIPQTALSMLRLLAKEMNCVIVQPYCDLPEEECLYSHHCPHGKGCTFGEKCWFYEDHLENHGQGEGGE